MAGRIRIRKHEAVLGCGYFEVRLPGRTPRFFDFDDLAGRHLAGDLSSEQALEQAKALAPLQEGN